MGLRESAGVHLRLESFGARLNKWDHFRGFVSNQRKSLGEKGFVSEVDKTDYGSIRRFTLKTPEKKKEWHLVVVGGLCVHIYQF
jgi:hypothetical protein